MAQSLLVLAMATQVIVNPALAAVSQKPSRPLLATSWVRTRDVRKSLSDVMDDTLAHEHQKAHEVRVERLTDILSPLYAALPKNGKGLLGHSTVRYALHRHFVHKHGMYVKGFEPAGEAWNSSSPTDILEDKVPGYVQHLFEERLHDGFDLKELALLAATLEHFVHLEAIDRLKGAYRLNGFDVDELLKPAQLGQVLEAYSFLQLVGGDFNTIAVDEFKQQFDQATEIFPEWPETQNFLRELQESIVDGSGEEATISFAIATTVIEAEIQRYGRFQDGGCRSLAQELLAKEEHGTGRVKLADFYQAGWQFKESRDYLRALGALDETGNYGSASVIISNYIASASNCIGTSSMYSVCCIDQCEELLSHLERRIAAPDATPETIVGLVAALPSATTKAPRHLSVTLVRRLNEIAERHGGKVPLHGRLFAQWLHHAYPRECPFPAAAGTTKPMTADDWLKETDKNLTVSDEEIAEIVEQAQAIADQVKVHDLADGDLEETLPWTAQEELVFHNARPSFGHELRVLAKALATFAAFFCLTQKLVQLLQLGVPSKASKVSAFV